MEKYVGSGSGTASATNLWAQTYAFKTTMVGLIGKLLFRPFTFLILYFRGEHTVGNTTHKLVTEVVPNHGKPKLYQKIFHTVI